MHTPKWKKPSIWRSRKNGAGGAANNSDAPPLLNDADATASERRPNVPRLAERPNLRASAGNSSSEPAPALSIRSAATACSQLPSTQSAHTPQHLQHGTRKDGTLADRHTAKRDYWQLAVNELQAENASMGDQIAGMQRAAGVASNADFAVQLFKETQQARETLEAKRWKINAGSQEIVVRDQFDRLVKVVTSIKDVASAAASLDPVHAGLPLAGFCVLMQVVTNDSDQYGAVVAGVEEVITIVARYQQIEALYLLRPETVLKQEFERYLVSMYKHIIRYQISATCYYRRNTMLRFLRALPKLDDVSEVISTIRQDDAACRSIGQVFDSSDALERYQELLTRLERFEKHLVTQKDPGFLLTTVLVHDTVKRSTNTFFMGREDILHELETITRDTMKDPSPREQCRIVITGMGGLGKSELCLQLVQRVRQSLWGVFWVDVSTPSLAESAFLDIATRLQIPAQTWEDARQGLANVPKSWLMVLDNADDPHVDYQQYLPGGPSGVVILTSRNVECHQYATQKIISLDGLTGADARELLLRAAYVPHDQYLALKDDAQAVASLLGSHPLALIQAGSYVSRGHCSLAEYPGVFAQQRKRLLAFRPTQAQSRYRDVYTTFEASAEIMRSLSTEAAEDALQLLPVLAACSPSRLPLPLFEAGWTGAQTIPLSDVEDDDEEIGMTSWHVSHLPPPMQADRNAWDSFRLVEAIYLLKALSLVSTDTNSGFLSVSMHPLTHAWARDRQAVTEQQESWVTTGCLMAISRSDEALWQHHSRQLQPHLQALTSWEISRMFASEPPIKITSILVYCGWLLYDMRNDAKVFVLINSLLTHLALDRLTVDRRWLEVYDLNARNLINFGKVRQAVPLLEQVVKIKEKTLAEDHPSRLASLHVLAIACRADGQVKKAVSLLEQMVKIEEKTLAEDHPSRLASQHVLAMAYRADGQVKEAVSLLEHVVKIEEKTLAEDHPSRLVSQHELAMVYKANGQVKEAVSLLEHVVKIKEKTSAEDYPSRLASQHVLAMAYRADGQVKEAVSLLEHVVKIEEKTLADDHPHRLVSQHNLAITYWDLGRCDTALQMMKHVVEIRRQVLEEDHPHRMASEERLQHFENVMHDAEHA